MPGTGTARHALSKTHQQRRTTRALLRHIEGLVNTPGCKSAYFLEQLRKCLTFLENTGGFRSPMALVRG